MHPINLHHKEDIYYVVLAAILMHNIMIEARVENDEVENANLYNTLSATESENSCDTANRKHPYTVRTLANGQSVR